MGIAISHTTYCLKVFPYPTANAPDSTRRCFDRSRLRLGHRRMVLLGKGKQAGSGDVKAMIIARNNTRETVKQGTVIHFSTNGGVNGAFTLTADLLSGQEKPLGKEDVVPYTCQAYYIKN